MEDNLKLTNRILLGLLMIVPGLTKLFIMKPAAIEAMLSGSALFNWAASVPMVFAWILIIAEICSGAAILANYKLKYSTIPPMIILLIAGIFFGFNYSNAGTYPTLLLHLVAISGYAMLGFSKKR